MKKNTKKGFTLVELVIVIAVIAILSAILIPTFGDIISNANETAYQKAANSAFTEAMEKAADKVSFKYAIVIYFDGGVKVGQEDVLDSTSKPTRAYKIDSNNQVTMLQNVTEGYDGLLTVDATKAPNLVEGVKVVDLGDSVKLYDNSEKTIYKVNEKCAIAFFNA